MTVVDVALVILDCGGEVGGFDSPETAQAPTGHGNLQDQIRFGLGSGTVIGLEIVPECVELFRVIAGEAEGLGGQAVLEAVEADGSASFFGAGAGTLLSVGAVGGQLFFGNWSRHSR